MRQGLGADGQRGLVDVEVGGVEAVTRPVERCHPQPQQASGYMFQVTGEIFAAHAGEADLVNIRLADDILGGPHADRRDFGIVEDGLGPLEKRDIDAGARRRGESARDLGDTLLDLGGRAIAEGPDGPRDLHLVRDDIRAAPSADAAERDDGGIAHVDRSRDELIEARYQLGGHRDRIDRQMRTGGVAADPSNDDLNFLTASGQDADALTDPADAQIGIDMERR